MSTSSMIYRALYALGLTPWDNDTVPDELAALVHDVRVARALDVGCGTGTQSRWLAELGFDVTGVDVVPAAIARAQKRLGDAGLSARLIVADLASSAPELGEPFSLVLDYGCLHSVPDPARDGLVRAYARHTERGARLLVFAFQPRRGPGPKGAAREELERRLGDAWTLIGTRVDESTRAPRAFIRSGRPVWYAWERR